MTRGQRSASVSARLRQELAESRDARARLERRIIDAERARDAAVAWRQKAEKEGIPAVVAETARADAAVKAASEATERERQWWLDRCAALAPTWQRILEAVGDSPVLDTGSIDALADLFGSSALPKRLVARNQRRNLRSGSQVRKIEKMREEAEKLGVKL